MSQSTAVALAPSPAALSPLIDADMDAAAEYSSPRRRRRRCGRIGPTSTSSRTTPPRAA